MSYKQNAASNRDALFGGGGKKTKAKSSSKGSRNPTTTSVSTPAATTSMGYKYSSSAKKKSSKKPTLSGEAKTVALKEAEEYQKKAKKCMQKSLFTKPDPLAASSYYKRAADNYQRCGEYRQEKFNRMNNAECQRKLGAYATAASEFTRAAELVEQEVIEKVTDESIEMKREIGRKLHRDAADAFYNANERAKSAASKVQAALALIWGDESRLLPGVALSAIEEAVEAHVPDPLNPYSRYRQSGVSAYIDANSGETAEKPSPEALELAKQQIVTRAYAHESVQEVVYLLVSYGEYASALYASGAVTTLLFENKVSTLSLSRAFLAETVLTLAMGDPIAAEEAFLNRHVQSSSYLTSRECKLAEELFRAIKTRDSGKQKYIEFFVSLFKFCYLTSVFFRDVGGSSIDKRKQQSSDWQPPRVSS